MAFLFTVGLPAQVSARLGPGQYQLATFNLLHDFPNYKLRKERTAMVASAIARGQIDIVGLQEASITSAGGNVATQLAKKLGYYRVFLPIEGSDLIGFWSGPAVVSRFPIVGSEVHRFAQQAGKSNRRSVARVVVRTPTGDISVYVAHLSGEPQKLNVAQAADLAQYVESTRGSNPAVVAGDFNAEPDWPSIRMLERARGYINTYKAANRRTAPTSCVTITPGYFNPFDHCLPKDVFRHTIDYLFLVPGRTFSGEVLSSRLFLNTPGRTKAGRELWASDHVGIVSVLQLSARPL